MGYGRKIAEEARQEIDRRRNHAEATAAEKLQSFYALYPRGEEIESELAGCGAGAAKAVLQGGDVRAEMERLKAKSLSLQEEYDRLLQSAGLTRRDVTPQYTCKKCKDTGFADGRMCSCLRDAQRHMAYEKLSMVVPLDKSTFEAFRLDYYREDARAYQQMENVVRACRTYADKFRGDSPSLLFKGKTGLGKTHLSLAIANVALEKGYGVVYGSAQSFAVALEKERFDKADPDDLGDTNSQLMSCDLLILDDLGTEFPSNYVNAALYNVINTRLLANKPTIISTNLSMKELEDRYSERFASRITGYYGKLEFLGSDVRVQMRKQSRA